MRVPSETVFAVGFPARTDGYWIAGLLVSTGLLFERPLSRFAIPTLWVVTFVWCVRSGYYRPNVVPAMVVGCLGLVCSAVLIGGAMSSLNDERKIVWSTIEMWLSVYGVVGLMGVVYGTVGHVLGRALQL